MPVELPTIIFSCLSSCLSNSSAEGSRLLTTRLTLVPAGIRTSGGSNRGARIVRSISPGLIPRRLRRPLARRSLRRNRGSEIHRPKAGMTLLRNRIACSQISFRKINDNNSHLRIQAWRNLSTAGFTGHGPMLAARGGDDAQIGADARSLRALVSSRRRFDLRRNRGLNVPYRARVMNSHFPDAVQ